MAELILELAFPMLDTIDILRVSEVYKWRKTAYCRDYGNAQTKYKSK
jgi:hypothetical protein